MPVKLPYNKTTLSNGVRVITVPLKDTQNVTVMVLVGAGAYDESKKMNGISHFLEHMAFKGTASWPTSQALSYHLDSIGADHNAFTSGRYTGYWAKAHKSHLNSIFDTVAELYVKPLLPKEEIEKERGVIIEEINRANDNNARILGITLDQLLYGDQPAGRTTLGPKENIKRFTINDFKKHRQTFYVPTNTTVVVAGNVEHAAIIKKAETQFGHHVFPKTNATVPARVTTKIRQTTPQARIFYKKTDQTKLAIAFRAFDMYDNRRYALTLLAAILGQGMSSRLWNIMREEKGICYSIRAYTSLSYDHGELQISSGVGHARVDEAITGILHEVRRMRDEIIPEHEVQKAKDFIIGNMFLDLESSDQFASYYGFQELARGEMITPEDYVERLKTVTTKDIQDVAKTIFVEKGLNLAIVGPHKNETKFKKLLVL